MAEIITRFRVNVNGVEQDAQVCYQNLANKPTFKTINGKAVVVSRGDAETDLKLATADETASLRNRVTNLEQNGTGGGGGGSGTPYDDTEVRALITAEQNRATAKEASLEMQVNTIRGDFNGFTSYAENNYAKVGDLGNLATYLNITNNAVEELENRVSNLEASGGSGGGSVDLNDYYKKTETYSKKEIDTKIANAGSGGTIELDNYVDKSSYQQITGNKTFTGNLTIGGKLCDKNASQGTAGQILSSTGNGVAWIDAPSGGGSDTDVSDLEARINELEDFTDYAEDMYARKTDVGNLIDEKIAAALAAIPVAEGGAY